MQIFSTNFKPSPPVRLRLLDYSSTSGKLESVLQDHSTNITALFETASRFRSQFGHPLSNQTLGISVKDYERIKNLFGKFIDLYSGNSALKTSLFAIECPDRWDFFAEANAMAFAKQINNTRFDCEKWNGEIFKVPQDPNGLTSCLTLTAQASVAETKNLEESYPADRKGVSINCVFSEALPETPCYFHTLESKSLNGVMINQSEVIKIDPNGAPTSINAEASSSIPRYAQYIKAEMPDKNSSFSAISGVGEVAKIGLGWMSAIYFMYKASTELENLKKEEKQNEKTTSLETNRHTSPPSYNQTKPTASRSKAIAYTTAAVASSAYTIFKCM